VWDIESPGCFDLTKLLVGSQGTLGVITEITLKTIPFPTSFVLIAGYFSSIENAALATGELLALSPSALEIVDKNLLKLVEEREPGHLKGLVPDTLPEIVLVIEFDDADDKKRLAKGCAAQTILEKYAFHYKEEKDPSEQDRLWDLRRSSAAVIWTVPGDMKALPIVEDGVVPPALLPEFFRRAYELFDKYELRIAIWGHAGDANLHMQPFMNLSDPKDREKIWPFVEEFHALIMSMGGCISAEHNDGLLRSPYIKAQYGEELYEIFRSVKHIFDPYSILNPGKKIDVSLESIKPLLRDSYNLNHLVKNAEEINR
jgi:FAD/FMN-containing dehydrogenase